jgi:hypothetical protein
MLVLAPGLMLVPVWPRPGPVRPVRIWLVTVWPDPARPVLTRIVVVWPRLARRVAAWARMT